MKKVLLCIVLLAMSSTTMAANRLLVEGAKVTSVRSYETTDGTTNVYLSINGQGRIGPNPDVPSVNCELWTNSKNVFSIALAAKSSGQKVNIDYVAAGTSDAFCKVRYLEVIE